MCVCVCVCVCIYIDLMTPKSIEIIWGPYTLYM